MKSLGKIIKKKKATKNVEALRNLLRKAPYSQPIQKLAKELSLSDSADSLYRYEWYKEADDQKEQTDQELVVDVISLDRDKSKKKNKVKSSKNIKPKKKKESEATVEKKKKKAEIDVKAKKKKTKKANSDSIKSHKPKTRATSNQSENELAVTSTQKSKKTAKKSKGKKKVSGQLDDYTIWLNSLSSDKAALFGKSKKVKKKKSRSNTKKDALKADLKKKINDSTKANKKIASKSLAKLYTKKGHYKKAIKVYEELSLKNPKKSSFFAAQIEKLKNKK